MGRETTTTTPHSRISSAVRGPKYGTLPPEETRDRLQSLLHGYYERKGQPSDGEQVSKTSSFLDDDLRRYYGQTLTFEEVEIAIDLGLHGEYGEYNGLNADRLFRFVRAYAMSDARADAVRQEKVSAGQAAPRDSREDVGLLNWNAMLRYTRERWGEFRSSGRLEGLGQTRGEIIAQVLGTVQRHNMADSYKWLKSVGLVEVDADCMELESRALREAERILGDGSPRWKVEDLGYAKMLEGFFTVCRAQSFDLYGELAALDRDTPAGERKFWSR